MIKFVSCRRFTPGTPVSSTKKTDRHDTTGILLKVAFSTITLNLIFTFVYVVVVVVGFYI